MKLVLRKRVFLPPGVASGRKDLRTYGLGLGSGCRGQCFGFRVKSTVAFGCLAGFSVRTTLSPHTQLSYHSLPKLANATKL